VYWDEIRQTQVIALHVPETLKGLKIELVAAKE
jgi:predicted component of type VI protein secretion system